MGIHPLANRPLHLGLQKIEMAGFAHLQRPRPGNDGVGFDQIHRIEQGIAIVALVAARLAETTDWACALNIAVRKKAFVLEGIQQSVDALFYESLVLEDIGEVLRQPRVLRRR